MDQYRSNYLIIKIIIVYTNENEVILDINEKYKYKDNVLIRSANISNIIIIKLLINYANENNTILDVNER